MREQRAELKEVREASDQIAVAGPWITEREVAAVTDALRHGWYEHAYDYCERFEREFASYHDRKYGIMTPSCTTALHLLLTGLGIGEGDEVIVPESTWIASAAPVTYVRATPVFCDIEAQHWCLDPAAVERDITARTKAIIAVDLYGNMPLLDELTAVAERHGLYLIEDAAEALGSVYRGVRAGKFGAASVFSFHRTKTLTTGEGGMLLTDNAALYERCLFWRDHGRKAGGPKYYNYAVTYKYMPFNVQAALGWAQLQRIEELVGRKRWILELYRRRLSGMGDLQLNTEPEGGVNGAWATAVVFGRALGITRARAMADLEKMNIPTRPFYYPLSSLPAYPGQVAAGRERNPRAYDISDRGIHLPCALNLTEESIEQVCDGITEIVEHAA